MGCKLDEDEEALCVVRDFSGTSQEIKVTLSVPAKMTIRGFIREVSRKFNFDPTSIQLVSPSKNFILYPGEILFGSVKISQLTQNGEISVPICVHRENGELVNGENFTVKLNYSLSYYDDDDFMIDKVSFISGTRNLFVVEGLNNCPPKLASKEDDLEIGASASPDEAVTEGPQPELPPGLNISNFYPICSSWKSSPYITPESSNRILGFRGLVNQAMTCYLNSLLQALYMTPEFRNAIYNWKFDRSTCADEAKSIPFQLQKLFLNLQMSTQSSVHTTELTRSFGWDSSEAWQQHDIQELCRVMFDALEQEFKGTDQADLINRLYCGKMIDYVKCLDCGTEKTREDTFSDIPLPIRPHGSVVAYSSVEEALRGFVQPETLDGNNQYFCEKCNRKCDAHKGLKFSKFPYLLTLHLMRFDFDYNSMHRIKLNDRVSFPEILNLNSIISSSSWTTLDKEEGSEGYPEEMTGTSSKCDDSSTTDSGSAIDDESCGIASSNDLNVEYDQDVDEGIDLSTQENEKTRKAKMEKGPYIYELFAVMVHAGSATGGHYYVLIKDLHSGEWYSFNDQTVNRVTPEDITRVYGGGPSRSYYTSSYGSNNNAYMLMYRQIDKEKNTLPMTEQEFPDHIKELLENLEDRSDLDLRIRDKEKETFKIKVFVKHPVLNHNIDVKIECLYNTSLPEVTQLAYNKLQLEGVVPLNQCRLVIYNSISGTIEGSLENCMSDSIGNILSSYNVKKGEMWLDIRPAEKEFVTYKPSSVMIPVYNINLETEVVQNQTTICISMLSLVGELKLQLYEHFGIHPVYDLHLFKVTGDGIFKFVDNENYSLREAGLYPNAKLFVCFVENISRTQCRLTIRRIVDKFENTIHLRVFLPSKTEISEFKQNLSLASYIYDFMRTEDNVSNSKSEAESNNNAQNNVTNSNNGESGNNGLLLPLLLSTPPLNANDPEISEVHSQLSNSGLMSATHHSDQSTSEDSSLTDSDRTIIGDPHQDDCPMPSNESSPNGSQCCSSPSDNLFCKEDELNIVNDITETEDKKNYFKIVGIFESDPTRVMKVEVDRRISPDVFKKALEPHVGISTAHFRLYDDIQALHESCMLGSFEITSLVNVKPEDPLHVKLGRSDKLRGTIFLLDLCSTTQENDELFTWTMDRQSTVGETKKKILQEYNEVKRSAIPFNRCRLRKKYSKTPGQIFPESKTWKDLNLCNNFEIYLQLLRGAEQMKTSDDEYCLTLCRVQPLDKTPVFEEIVVPRTNMLDLLTRISEKTGIPEKDLIIGKDPRDNFKFGECDNIDWTSMLISDSWPSFINEDGYVLYYRDTRDPIHSTVIVHERNNTRNDRKLKSTKMRMEAALTNKVTFMSSPKKEKSLRITVDKPCM